MLISSRTRSKSNPRSVQLIVTCRIISSRNSSAFQNGTGIRMFEQLTKALAVKFSSDRANASLSGLTLLQARVEHFLQIYDILTGCRCTRDRLAPKLAIL